MDFLNKLICVIGCIFFAFCFLIDKDGGKTDIFMSLTFLSLSHLIDGVKS